jgi:hypothetical protein
MKRKLTVGALLILLSASPALAQCENLPADAQNYLKAHPGWRVPEVKDIDDPDDQKAWMNKRPALCPGLAVVDVDGSHRMSYALALLGNRGGKTHEQVVLLWHDGKPQPAQTLVDPFPVGPHVGPHMVIWRLEPGVYEAWDTHKKTRIAHDSVGFEALEASVRLYYFSKGKFHILTTSD